MDLHNNDAGSVSPISLNDFINQEISFPFRDLVEQSTGHKILPITAEHEPVIAEFEHWLAANYSRLIEFGEQYRGRVNEFGNAIERFIQDEFQVNGVSLNRPKNGSGQRVSAGYPDFILDEEDVAPVYLEVKAFNVDNADSSLRTFYASYGNLPKIQSDAPHLLLMFPFVDKGQGARTIQNDYKLKDLYNFNCKIKIEINASNKDTLGCEDVVVG